MTEPLLRVRSLTKVFRTGTRASHRAVDDVSFDLYTGETLGLVGESGSGKSTTARCIMRLIKPTSGEVTLDGVDVLGASRRELRDVRRGVQMVFQDPYSSLDPRMKVRDIVAEGMRINRIAASAAEERARVAELLELVGLRPDHLDRRPASFSGGERQRIGIARALAVNPRLLICDEPIASLDVSIQAQVLNLFTDLRRELGLSILFIAHDLATVRFLCDRIAVMENGRLVEIGDRSEIYGDPQHPYTRALIDAAPEPSPEHERAKREDRLRRRRNGDEAAAEASGPAEVAAPASEMDQPGAHSTAHTTTTQQSSRPPAVTWLRSIKERQ
ncbi:ABC transporter ATP-binding protein [Microbacterium ulmi]|uniref:ABC transporter ATP-binding protein n=1 Tax=Microbacterium ulmi TaxID=179095 RepID=UPI001ABA3BE2|nr:ATP-binding cassette domain-containing protein [Microbacterium ulmi]NII69836.1 ABC-type oligopeptide transport system ATPase subunit [Microbacterium ulmi]